MTLFHFFIIIFIFENLQNLHQHTTMLLVRNWKKHKKITVVQKHNHNHHTITTTVIWVDEVSIDFISLVISFYVSIVSCISWFGFTRSQSNMIVFSLYFNRLHFEVPVILLASLSASTRCKVAGRGAPSAQWVVYHFQSSNADRSAASSTTWRGSTFFVNRSVTECRGFRIWLLLARSYVEKQDMRILGCNGIAFYSDLIINW